MACKVDTGLTGRIVGIYAAPNPPGEADDKAGKIGGEILADAQVEEENPRERFLRKRWVPVVPLGR